MKNYNRKIFLFLLCCTVVFSCNKYKNNNEQNKIFVIDKNISIENYKDTKGYIPKEGFVQTAIIACQVTELVLTPIYGKAKIESEKPFSVNLENGIWVIEGHLKDDFQGGVVHVELRKSNGEVLKVIHGK